MSGPRPKGRAGLVVTGVVFTATVLQLAVATFATGLPQFSGKGLGQNGSTWKRTL